MEANYLQLTEYSSKHKVSISTLRRKIKANEIEFRFDQGKYFILDDGRRPSPEPQRPSLAAASANIEKTVLMNTEQDVLNSSTAGLNEGDEPIISAANRLLTELKRAYTQILQEKEEQILHLREEVTDLKTLVRVLEAENERLR